VAGKFASIRFATNCQDSAAADVVSVTLDQKRCLVIGPRQEGDTVGGNTEASATQSTRPFLPAGGRVGGERPSIRPTHH
jgi:hypothetical protein